MGKAKIDFNNMYLGFDEINSSNKENELTFKKVKVNQLDENPENNRIYEYDKEADEFLKEDIRCNGVMNPIVIVKSELHAGRYTIVSGHRRTRVAKELGIFELEAREIIACTPEEKAFVQIMLITANSTQRDRKPSEKAREVQYLKLLMKDNDGVENTAKWISNATKMSERNVYRYEKLANQPKNVQESVDKGEITVKQAIGENRENASKKKDAVIAKKVDINKTTKQILKLLKNIDEAIKAGNTIVIDEVERRYLKESAKIIKNILGQSG